MIAHATFGSTGLRVPPLVFGTTSLGNLYRKLPYAEKRAIVAELIRSVPAPVVIDTAGKYGAGLALEVLGQSLRELAVPADDVVIINKLGWLRTPLGSPEPTFEPGAWVGLDHDAGQRISGAGILKCHAQGCELLGAPYRPQLVAVHDPDEYLAAAADAEQRVARLADIVAACHRLAELRDRGEVAGVGVGAKDWRVVREIDSLVPLDWVMLANSLTVYRHEPELLEFVASLQERGVGIINAAVFHGGFVVGGEHFDYRALVPGATDTVALHAWRDRFFALCADTGVQPAAAALKFGVGVPGVTAVAVATDRPEQIGELVDCFASALPAGFWAEARRRHVIDAGYPHLR